MISYVFGVKFDASEIIDWENQKDCLLWKIKCYNAPNAKFKTNKYYLQQILMLIFFFLVLVLQKLLLLFVDQQMLSLQ
ncbi:unnamed protein product [Paramecium sonneborni]|uniref:Uncharacterized protein n=1 Tax=Paramecium sonneborni TaxID=65129 RepID=A0A8S1M427_9CILI|nr:unnamed protein product [Paramecium sonneborni]